MKKVFNFTFAIIDWIVSMIFAAIDNMTATSFLIVMLVGGFIANMIRKEDREEMLSMLSYLAPTVIGILLVAVILLCIIYAWDALRSHVYKIKK